MLARRSVIHELVTGRSETVKLSEHAPRGGRAPLLLYTRYILYYILRIFYHHDAVAFPYQICILAPRVSSPVHVFIKLRGFSRSIVPLVNELFCDPARPRDCEVTWSSNLFTVLYSCYRHRIQISSVMILILIYSAECFS